MTAFVPVYANLATGRFVAGRKSTQNTSHPLDQIFHRNSFNLKVYPLVNNPLASIGSGDPFHLADVSGLSLVAAILDTAGNVLAQGSSFTADTAQNTLTGALNCDVVAMETYATDISAGKDAIIEFRFTGAFGSRTCRALSRVFKQVNVTGTPDPDPTVTYITSGEFNARALLRDGEAGEVKTWISAGGTMRIQYLGDDGELHLDPI